MAEEFSGTPPAVCRAVAAHLDASDQVLALAEQVLLGPQTPEAWLMWAAALHEANRNLAAAWAVLTEWTERDA